MDGPGSLGQKKNLTGVKATVVLDGSLYVPVKLIAL